MPLREGLKDYAAIRSVQLRFNRSLVPEADDLGENTALFVIIDSIPLLQKN